MPRRSPPRRCAPRPEAPSSRRREASGPTGWSPQATSSSTATLCPRAPSSGFASGGSPAHCASSRSRNRDAVGSPRVEADDRPRRHPTGRGDPGRGVARRLRDPEPGLADGTRPGPRVVSGGLRGLLAHRCGLPVGDALASPGRTPRRRRAPRHGQPLSRRDRLGAALRGLDTAVREDGPPLRPRPGGARRRGARALSRLRRRLPRAGERDRLRGRLRGVGGRRRARRALPVRPVVRCRGGGDGAHRADPSGKPGVPGGRDPPAPPSRPLARACRPDRRVRRCG